MPATLLWRVTRHSCLSLFACASILAGCNPDTQSEDDVDVAVSRDLACNDVVAANDRERSANFLERRAEFLGNALGSPVARDNETHDCQRLIIPADSPYYGPLVTLFVHPALAQVGSSKQVVWVGTITNKEKPSAVAPYTDLHITELKNCVYLYFEKEWQAWIVPVDPSNASNNCATLRPQPGDTANKLPVYAKSAQSPWPVSRPAAGRIIDAGQKYYIGLQCPGSWCVIGLDEKVDDPGTLPSIRDALGDQQRLGVGESIRPTEIMAELWPNYELIYRPTNPDFGTEVLGHTIVFKGGSLADRAEYAKKLDIERPYILPDTIQMWIKYDRELWFDLYYKTTGGTLLKAMKSKQLGGMAAGMAATRFQWREKDEGFWVQCATGCCGAEWP